MEWSRRVHKYNCILYSKRPNQRPRQPDLGTFCGEQVIHRLAPIQPTPPPGGPILDILSRPQAAPARTGTAAPARTGTAAPRSGPTGSATSPRTRPTGSQWVEKVCVSKKNPCELRGDPTCRYSPQKSFTPLTLISLYFKIPIPVKSSKIIRSSSNLWNCLIVSVKDS